MTDNPLIVVITGASKLSGLGYATAARLLRSPNPFKIFLTSRSLAASTKAVLSLQETLHGQADVRTVVPMEVDIDDDQGIGKFARELAEQTDHIDVLINNAGAHYDFALRDGKLSTREAFNRSCNTNIASTSLLTAALAPLLIQAVAPRLLFLSSSVSSLSNYPTDPIASSPPAGWPKEYTFNLMNYRTSKTGTNMIASEWARILKNDGVKVFALDPGLLATDFGGADPNEARSRGAIDVGIGADFVVDVVEGHWDHATGRLICSDGILPW